MLTSFSRYKRLALIVLSLYMLLFSLSGCALLESLFPSEAEDVFEEDLLEDNPGFRKTVLYFETDDGFMVPVMKLLPWEEGIGRAALNQLIDTDTNRISAAAMGLKNVVPPGVSFVLSISSDAVATVNIKDLPTLKNAEAEQRFVTAVVNTLTEFPTIDKVKLEFNGKTKKALKHGTDVHAAMRALPLNAEPLPVNAGEGKQYALNLYYPNPSASLNIPVTRAVTSEPTLMIAMSELVKGPSSLLLRNCFPENTEVLSASLDGAVGAVNLSKDFLKLEDTPDLMQAAIECMQLTARAFGATESLVLQVEGADYDYETLLSSAAPVFANVYR